MALSHILGNPSTQQANYVLTSLGGLGTKATWQAVAVDPNPTFNSVTTTDIKILNSPANGYVLTSDVVGNGTWQPPQPGLVAINADSLSSDMIGDIIPAPNTKLVTGAVLQKAGQVVQASSTPFAQQAAMVESPQVFFDDKGPNATNLWYMVYTGYAGSFGSPSGAYAMLASSADMYNWTQLGPILGPGGSGSYDTGGYTANTITFNPADNLYYLHSTGLSVLGYETGVKSMTAATSSVVTGSYAKYSGNPIIAPPGGTTLWYANAIYERSIIPPKSPGSSLTLWTMFFNAEGYVSASQKERVGYATSPDLLNWTINPTPSLPDLVSPQAWESSGIVGDPSIYRLGDYYIMAYYSTGTGGASDGLAYTTISNFPTGWTRWSSVNPVLSIGTEYDACDSVFAHKPRCLYNNGTLYHYYTAVNSSSRSIALAVQSLSGPAGDSVGGARKHSIGLINDSTISLANNMNTPFPWDSVQWLESPNNAIDFIYPVPGDSTNSQIQVTKDGFYIIHCYNNFDISSGEATGLCTLAIGVNGTKTWCQDINNILVASSTSRLNTTAPIHLNANDVVTAIVYQNNLTSSARTVGTIGPNVTENQAMISIIRL